MAKSRLSRARIGGWVVAGGFLLLVLGVLGYHVITASGQSSVFAAGQCVLAAAALASAAALAYGYQRGLIQRRTKQEEAVVQAVRLGFFRVLLAAIVAAAVGAKCFGVPGESLPAAIDVSVFWLVVSGGVVCWLMWSVIRASDKAFFRILGAAVITAVIGDDLLRALGWPELMSIDRRAVGTLLFWALFAIGVMWGLIRGAQGFCAALKVEVETSQTSPVADKNTRQK